MERMTTKWKTNWCPRQKQQPEAEATETDEILGDQPATPDESEPDEILGDQPITPSETIDDQPRDDGLMVFIDNFNVNGDDYISL